MTEDEIWQVIHARRLGVAALLDDLASDEWARPSLCAGWTVRDVAAHLTMQQMTLRDELALLLRWRGGGMDRLTAGAARRKAAAREPAELAAEIRETAAARRRNAGVTCRETLADLLIHEQDIALPLGRRRDMPPAAAAEVATRLLTMRFPPPLPSVRQVAGLRLAATDVAWTHGDGPSLQGPIAALLLTIAGRTAALSELSGPGLAKISSSP
ncbi:maleylpyruvate isomerase family mycothiol-dependent enzyme [Actinoplanes sp. NPDC051513]|uniref:maleylpyruvate isomerase family mycothiol-dependent enzyme n=1 Tax=Actinoplanes sp. NPDC051513 TaxID=3363908 RepID=UPI0037A3A57B